MRSNRNAEDVMMMCCASCGQAEIDDIKLKKCNGGCDLVKYCRDVCQENHRKQHEEECKKRRAELRDRDLFRKSEGSYLGECPICCLPLPLDENKSTMMPCCSKNICRGCEYANQMRENEEGLEHKCAYCREPVPDSREKAEKYMMKRVKKNDPNAMCFKPPYSTRKGIIKVHLNFGQMLLDWVMPKRIIIYHVCIARGRLLRRTRRSIFTT
jgi:hypothetical protein